MQHLVKLLIVLVVVVSANAMIHNFDIKSDDTRKIIPIGDFGFAENGSLHVNITRSNNTEVLNFIIYETKNSFSQEQFLLEDACDVKNPGFVNATDSFSVNFATDAGNKYLYDEEKTPFTDNTVNYLPPGYYHVFLLRCSNEYQKTTIKIHWDAHNVNKNGQNDYLSAGMKNVFPVSFVFAFLWIAFAIFWIALMLKGRKKVNRVHFFLSAFIVLAAISLFFEGGQYQIMSKSGRKKAMGIFYYFFTIVRGLSFFLIIVIIGTGLTFIKKHLSRKEMGIIATVIILQILVNLALVFVGNMSKSNPHRSFCLIVFRLGDLICCCCVVVPVLWSLSDLRARADTQSDGDAAAADQKSITKLKLFQRYYLLVVGYVYLRIIVIYMLNLYVKYDNEWTIDLVDEILSLGFYAFICYLFRPEAENPFIEFEDGDAYVAPTLSETHTDDVQMDDIDSTDMKGQNSAVLVPDE